jgi:hypothetical protein
MVEIVINIQKYAAYFHDGAVIDIQHRDDEIIFSLESAEIDLSDIHDELELSERDTIKGKLHVIKPKLIHVNREIISTYLKMRYDSANIFDLEIAKNVVKLAVSWENFPPKPYVNDFSTIKIEALEIWWENIPDLYDPFW